MKYPDTPIMEVRETAEEWLLWNGWDLIAQFKKSAFKKLEVNHTRFRLLERLRRERRIENQSPAREVK